MRMGMSPSMPMRVSKGMGMNMNMRRPPFAQHFSIERFCR